MLVISGSRPTPARRRLDVAAWRCGRREEVAKVKAAARPWRSIFLLVLAVMMATLSRSARTAAASEYFADTAYRALGHTGTEALSADAAAVAFCLLAYLGTAGLAGRAGSS